MLIYREIRPRILLQVTWQYFVAMATYSSLAVTIYYYGGLNWLRLPWGVLMVIGTAVAFYLGFKNNSSYERQWEARKIWGAIVNSSRSWGIMVMDYVTDQFVDGSVKPSELHAVKRKLIYRHIAWLYCLRRQLWEPRHWELRRLVAGRARRRWHLRFTNGSVESEIRPFLDSEEMGEIMSAANSATQIVAAQSATLRELRACDWIDDFRHMVMGNRLVDLYTQQGKCERIKNYPFPRQYANSSFVFVLIFLLLLPFGIMSEFAQFGPHAVWLTVPFSVLVGWVYWLMEIVGDLAENPFEGSALDTPMTSICRTIEIDLREMLGESDLPPRVEPIDGVLL